MDTHTVDPVVELEEWVTPDLVELQADDARSSIFGPGGDANYGS